MSKTSRRGVASEQVFRAAKAHRTAGAAAAGFQHSRAPTARSNLAAAHFADGRLTKVVSLLQQTLADGERHLGSDHPLTRTVRDNLETARRT